MSDENFDRFKACAVEVLSIDAEKIKPEATFEEDLEADSLDLMEFVMALEEEFNVSVPEEELEDVKTVGNAFDLIVSKIA